MTLSWLLGIPFPAVLAIMASVLGFFALGSLRFGRHVVAIGANAEAARRAGIAVKQRLVMVYVLTGVAAAVAGIGNGLNLSHVLLFYTQIVTGMIILVEIWLNTRVFAQLAAPVGKP